MTNHTATARKLAEATVYQTRCNVCQEVTIVTRRIDETDHCLLLNHTRRCEVPGRRPTPKAHLGDVLRHYTVEVAS